jgi:large-conductance mechanosensitive channel
MGRFDNLLSFIVSERLLSITVICSIITFQFISTFKLNIVDPILDFMLPEEKFNYLNFTIRDGNEVPKIENKKLVLDFGQIIKELFKWGFVLTILYLLARYTSIQDEVKGNPGSAIM